MNVRRATQKVRAILEDNGLCFSMREEEFALRFSSAMLLVGFSTVGTQTLITLRAPILQNVPVGGGRTDRILRELNLRNCESHFGKWMLYEDLQLIALEYDLLGDQLQEEELMTALATLARLADHQDDLLQKKLGGSRAFECHGI